MDVLIVKSRLTPLGEKKLKDLPVGSYLLLMEKGSGKNYWAICTVDQGSNFMVVVIDGHFSFDIPDRVLGYIAMENPDD